MYERERRGRHAIRGIKGPALAIALVAVGVLAVAGSAVATTVALTSVDDSIRAKAAKKTTVVRDDAPTGDVTSSATFRDINGMSSTITFTKPSILLVTLTAESICWGGSGAGRCSVRILADGVGELSPGFGNNFAFDSTNEGSETDHSWEGHAMQRSSNVLPPGTYTVRPQFAVVGPGVNFQMDDVHVTVEAVQV
jgi:hypothetical protein